MAGLEIQEWFFLEIKKLHPVFSSGWSLVSINLVL